MVEAAKKKSSEKEAQRTSERTDDRTNEGTNDERNDMFSLESNKAAREQHDNNWLGSVQLVALGS